MNNKITRTGSLFLAFFLLSVSVTTAQTISVWLFDETKGLYPSSALDNSSSNDYPLVLGLGGKIVPGKFGNALEISDALKLDIPKGDPRFGLSELPLQAGKKHAPLSWRTSQFGALMTSGEKHLRNEIGFANVTDTKLNIGSSDWTMECWLQLLPAGKNRRYLFEIGEGPLMEPGKVTALYIDGETGELVFQNDPSGTLVKMKTIALTNMLPWHHFAIVYNKETQTLSHYIDGKLTAKASHIKIKALSHGEEAFMSIGRDGNWNNQLNGRIDELSFSEGQLYKGNFTLPSSRSPLYAGSYKMPVLKKGLPLLFAGKQEGVLALGNRKHVFIDSAFIEKLDQMRFVVNPPAKMERVIDNIKSQFRKHLTVIEDEQGMIRIYNGSVDDYLAVYTSSDGVNFKAPDLGNGVYKGQKNIVLPVQNGGMGNPFIDPNGPPEERWKYISDYHRRGVYAYTSPDGYSWTRKKIAAFPFRTGSQSSTFYDDQRQTYVSYHRTDMFGLPGDGTQRSSVLTEFLDFNKQVPYTPLTQQQYLKVADSVQLRQPLPWFLDNGPLTPGGFGLEYPRSFDPIPQDPSETDIYVAKAQKYEWAPDTYLAFPTVYFHYEDAADPHRRILGSEKYERGSGPLETQLSVSRDGLHWKRYPRPAYIGIGPHLGRDIKTAYIAQGMIRRGNEIWQYYFGETQYHSAYKKDDGGRGVYRLVQRLDGFVSLDSPYEAEGTMVTRPFTFTGNNLELNIDTDAAGYAKVGFLDENGQPIKGFALEDCIYVNGDFVNEKVEWANKGKDVSELQGRAVKLVIQTRGSKLYALQFTNDNNTKK